MTWEGCSSKSGCCRELKNPIIWFFLLSWPLNGKDSKAVLHPEIIGRLSHASSQLCVVKNYFLFNTINSVLHKLFQPYWSVLDYEIASQRGISWLNYDWTREADLRCHLTAMIQIIQFEQKQFNSLHNTSGHTSAIIAVATRHHVSSWIWKRSLKMTNLPHVSGYLCCATAHSLHFIET